MKKILVVTALFAFTVTANAQFKEALKNKVNEKLNTNKSKESNTSENTNTEGTTEKNTNTNSTENTNTNTNSNTTEKQNQYMLNMGGKKEIRPSYTFQQNVLMEMKSYNKKGELKKDGVNKMRFHFSTEPYNGIEPVDNPDTKGSFSIFEADKNQMVSLTENDGNKMAIVMKMDANKVNQDAAKQNGSEKDQPTITKTGRTKTICGYLCEEWTSVDKDGNKSEMWITKDVPLTLNGSYAMFGATNKNTSSQFQNSSSYPQGFMMEITNYETNGEKFTMTCLEVNLKTEKKIDTTGYQVF